MKISTIALLAIGAFAATSVSAKTFNPTGDAEFDDTSWADNVIGLEAGDGYSSVKNGVTDSALDGPFARPPEYFSVASKYVSIGTNGRIDLGFIDNVIAGDGTDAEDVFIWEFGGNKNAVNETAQVFLGNVDDPSGKATFYDDLSDNFTFAGTVTGIQGIDVDKFLADNGFDSTQTFNAIRIVDDGVGVDENRNRPGYDLNAVSVTTNMPFTFRNAGDMADTNLAPVPLPATGLLLVGAVGALAARRRFA